MIINQRAGTVFCLGQSENSFTGPTKVVHTKKPMDSLCLFESCEIHLKECIFNDNYIKFIYIF